MGVNRLKLVAIAGVILALFGCGSKSEPPASTIASIDVRPASATISTCCSQQFTAVALDTSFNSIPGVVFTWSSSDPATACVNQSGLAVALTNNDPVGTTISAKSGTVSGSATLFLQFIGPPAPPANCL